MVRRPCTEEYRVTRYPDPKTVQGFVSCKRKVKRVGTESFVEIFDGMRS